MSCGSLLAGLLGFELAPAVGEQVGDFLVGPGINRLNDVGDVTAGVDAGGFGGRDEGQDAGEADCSAAGASELPRLSPGSDPAQVAFGTAVVSL